MAGAGPIAAAPRKDPQGSLPRQRCAKSNTRRARHPRCPRTRLPRCMVPCPPAPKRGATAYAVHDGTPHRSPSLPSAQPFDGSTEYNDQYVRVRLPPGMPCSLGLQVASKPYAQGGVGGQFLSMIPAGSSTPIIAQKTLTTTQDMQVNAVEGPSA